MKFTEAQLEITIIKFLEAEGYPHILGEMIGPDLEVEVLEK